LECDDSKGGNTVLKTSFSILVTPSTGSEVKYISTINVAEIQNRADELAKNYRDLDARVQELNWQTELVE